MGWADKYKKAQNGADERYQSLKTKDNIPAQYKMQDKPMSKELLAKLRYQKLIESTGEIKPADPQGGFSKAIDVSTNPLTAMGYVARNESIPDYFTRGERNTADYVVDLVNPFQYALDAKNLLQGVATGDMTQAGIGAVGVLPLGFQAKRIADAISPAVRTLPKAKSIKEAVGTFSGIPTERSLPRMPESEMNHFRAIQEIGRRRAKGKPISELYEYALKENLPEEHIKKVFNKTKEQISSRPSGFDATLDIIQARNRQRAAQLRNEPGDWNAIIDDAFDDVGDIDIDGTFSNMSQATRARLFGIDAPAPAQNWSAPQATGEISRRDPFSNIKEAAPQAARKVKEELTSSTGIIPTFKSNIKDIKDHYKNVVNHKIREFASPYPSPVTKADELIDIASLSPGTSERDFARRFYKELSDYAPTKGDIFTGSTNTSHSSYLPQTKQAFKYASTKRGEAQYLGHRKMNTMGYLTEFGYPKADIAKYLNTELDEQILRGIVPSNVQRPFVGEFNDIVLPQYGVKQNKNGGWAKKYENGGIIEDDRGQWAHPGEVTKINSNDITMEGVDYPVLGISDTGDKQMMMPGENYKFEGKSVTEYPMAKNGGWLDKYQNGGTVSEVWEQKTGTGWADAKEQGLTDGSYNSNISLLKDLNEGVYDTQQPEQNITPVSQESGALTAAPQKRTFNEAFKEARELQGPNKFFMYDGKSFATNIAGETFSPSDEDIAKFKLPKTTSKKIQEENKKIKSPYVSKNTVDLNPGYKLWDEVKQEKEEINKMSQADKIIHYKKSKAKNKVEEYTIKQGDNLSQIAKDNNISLEDLIRNNNITKPNSISSGQKLKLSSGEQYVIVDKAKGLAHVYNTGSEEPLYSTAVDVGENEGDAQTVTKINRKQADKNKDGIISEKEAAVAKADFSKGNKSTGAGRYKVSNLSPEGYKGKPLINLTNEQGVEVATSFHSGFVNDNNAKVSNGCIRCNPKTLDYLVSSLDQGSEVYILPEDDENSFTYENGQLNFKKQSKKDYDNYVDSKGVPRKGQGINTTTNTLNYKPIKLSFNEEAFREDKFDWYDFNDEKELNNTVKPFISALSKDKKSLMQDLKINGDVYNEIALATFGIFGVESGFGDTNALGTDIIKGVNRMGTEYINKNFGTNRQLPGAPDTQEEMLFNQMRGKEHENKASAGLTQIVWNQRSKEQKRLMTKYNIHSPRQLNNPRNAAIATIIMLGNRYNMEIKGKKDDQPLDESLAYVWNHGEGYAERVKRAKRFIELSEKE